MRSLYMLLIFLLCLGGAQALAKTEDRTAWMQAHKQPTHTISIFDPQVSATFYVTVVVPDAMERYEADRLIDDIGAWRIPLKDQSEISSNDTTFDRLSAVLRQEGVLITSQIDMKTMKIDPAIWYDSGRSAQAREASQERYYSNNVPLKASSFFNDDIDLDATFHPTAIKIKKFSQEKYVSATVYYADEADAREVAAVLTGMKVDAKVDRSSGAGGYYVTFPINQSFKSEKDVMNTLGKMGIDFENQPVDNYIAIKSAVATANSRGAQEPQEQISKENKVGNRLTNKRGSNPLMYPQKTNPLQVPH